MDHNAQSIFQQTAIESSVMRERAYAASTDATDRLSDTMPADWKSRVGGNEFVCWGHVPRPALPRNTYSQKSERPSLPSFETSKRPGELCTLISYTNVELRAPFALSGKGALAS
jgi:hypothetical protein